MGKMDIMLNLQIECQKSSLVSLNYGQERGGGSSVKTMSWDWSLPGRLEQMLYQSWAEKPVPILAASRFPVFLMASKALGGESMLHNPINTTEWLGHQRGVLEISWLGNDFVASHQALSSEHAPIDCHCYQKPSRFHQRKSRILSSQVLLFLKLRPLL